MPELSYLLVDPARRKRVLFTDFRHVQPGQLDWYAPDGRRLSLKPKPTEAPLDAIPCSLMQPHGIRLAAQPAQKLGPLENLAGDLVLYQEGRYRSWYWSGGCACYAESEDGFEWRRPELGAGTCGAGAEIGGDRANNAVFRPPAGQSHFDGFGLFADPEGPAGERYKLVYMANAPASEHARLWEQYRQLHPRYHDCRMAVHRERGELFAVYGAVSPDGLRWTPIPEPLLLADTDTPTTVYYDAWLGRYVMYTRWWDENRRGIARTETDDFRHWPPLQPLICPRIDESFSNDLYTNARTTYPGEPDYHLMFPMVYERWTQTSHVRLYASKDGIVWHAVPGGPIVRPGGPGEWDAEFIHLGRGLVPLAGDRVGVRYMASAFPHKFPRWQERQRLQPASGGEGWACWPKGRLSALVAEEMGEFFTFPLRPAGRELRLNLRARRGGGVRVGIHQATPPFHAYTGRSAADCDYLFGDSLSQPVHWRGETAVGIQAEEPIILHFKLRSAELFGFEWV